MLCQPMANAGPAYKFVTVDEPKRSFRHISFRQVLAEGMALFFFDIGIEVRLQVRDG